MICEKCQQEFEPELGQIVCNECYEEMEQLQPVDDEYCYPREEQK